MTTDPAPPSQPLQSASAIADAPRMHLKHPWNPQSDIYILPLSQGAGLTRAIVSLARVPPGKESFAYHSHEKDEEWIYVLSGRGRAEIDGKFYEVGAGDFMGFPAPGPAHHLSNPYSEDLVYLMGGERSSLDVGNFPRLGRKIIFGPSGIFAVETEKPMSFADYLAGD